MKKQSEKMMFHEDKYVSGELCFEKNKVYDIPVASVERWLRRGGIIVQGGNLSTTVEVPIETPPVDDVADLEVLDVGVSDIILEEVPEKKTKKTGKR